MDGGQLRPRHVDNRKAKANEVHMMNLGNRVKEQDLHIQRVIQNLYQINDCAKLLLAISRFKHDIDANYAGFYTQIQYLMVSTSHKRAFDAEKWFFCVNTTSIVGLRAKI